ncbi:MAG: FAD-dependent oxidoreductase [Polyangiales bacterium]
MAILGGGVAGMTAAHELVERGFTVRVFEAKPVAGGKARSVEVAGTGTGPRKDLPGEHGFRFFPGFYRHISDTMQRIPYGTNVDGVLGNLRAATRLQMARFNEGDPILVAHLPHTARGLISAIKTLAEANFGVPTKEALFFANRMFILLTSCEERRFGQWENVSWWDFIDAANKSLNYQRYLARGLTRTLVAMRAEDGSTRTVGYVLIQLFLDLLGANDAVDRILDGPTSDVWIHPWLDFLRAKGVEFNLGARASAIHMTGGSISSVAVQYDDGTTEDVVADFYISAMPKERLEPLVTPALRAAEPSLGGLHHLQTEWMNGIMFYLKDDVKIVNGHTIYVDTPWALTSISQQQFWEDRLSGYGDGTVRGILSVDISDWTRPGLLLGKSAAQMTNAEDIKNEVWEQLKESLNDGGEEILDEANVSTWYLDESIGFTASGATNAEPLLVNTKGSWQHRPEAATNVPNLVLAADYVRTHTDLATMEGANEAARRAVNAIIERSGSSASPCKVWPFREPRIFEGLKRWDRSRYAKGKAHFMRPKVTP